MTRGAVADTATGVWSAHEDTQDRAMTLLAAVRDGDRMCVAADSLEFRTVAGYGETVNKLERLGTLPVVWGIFGSTTCEDRLRPLLESPPGSWDDLSYKVEYASLLMDRESWQVGGFDVLFAGRLDDEWGIRAYGRHHRDSTPIGEWCFVGQNRLAAQVGMGLMPDGMSVEDRLLRAMTAVVDASAPMLGGPVIRWLITPDTCEPMD